MQSFKQYLNESRNTHLEHLEDEIVNNGYDGCVNAVNFLSSIRDMMLSAHIKKGMGSKLFGNKSYKTFRKKGF